MRLSLVFGIVTAPIFYFAFSGLAIAQQAEAAPIEKQIVRQAQTATDLYQTGQQLFYQGQYSQALDRLQQAVQQAQTMGDQQIEADAWTEIATLHLALSDKSLGHEATDRALALHENLQDPVGRAEALSLLAVAQFEIAADEVVLESAEEALAIFRAEGAQFQESILLTHLGSLAIKRKRYETGLGQLTQAAQLLETAPAEDGLAKDYYRGLIKLLQGVAYTGLKDIELAREAIGQALAIGQTKGMLAVEGSARFLEGLVYEVQADYETALVSYQSSVAILTEIGAHSLWQDVLKRMAGIFYSQGKAQTDPALAISLYQEAIKIAQQTLEIVINREETEKVIQYRLGLSQWFIEFAYLYQNLAQKQLKEGAFDVALDTLEQSITAAQRATDMTNLIEITSTNSAHINQALYFSTSAVGQAHNTKYQGFTALQQFDNSLQALHTAAKTFQVSLSYALASGDPELKTWANQLLANTYQSIGSVQRRLGNYEAGIVAIKTGLDHAQRAKDLNLEQQLLSDLPSLYRGRGKQYRLAQNYEQALIALQRGLSIAEELLTIAEQLQIDETPSLDANWTQSLLLAQWLLSSEISSVYKDQGDYANALSINQQTLAIAEQLDEPEHKLLTLSGIAVIYMNLSRYPEALDILEELQDIAQGDNWETSRVLAATIYDTMGRYSESIAIYEQVLDRAISQGDLQREINILNNLGSIHLARGEYAVALEKLTQALNAGRDLRGQLQAIDALDSQLEHLCSLSSSLETEASATDARLDGLRQHYNQLQQEHKRQLCIGRTWDLEQTTLNNIAIVHSNQGRYQEALDLHQQSLEIGQAQQFDQNSKATSLGNISSIYGEQGNYTQALKLRQQVLNIYKITGNQGGIAGSLNEIGVLKQNQGQYNQALKNLEQALTLSRQLGLRPLEGTIISNIGNLYSAQGQYAKADQYYIMSLELSRELGLQHDEAIRLANLGVLSSDRGQYDQAQTYGEQALAIFKNNGIIVEETNTMLTLGSIQRDQGNYAQALDLQTLALDTIQTIDALDDEAYALRELGITYLNLGQMDKALQNYQQALAINQDIGDRAEEARVLGLIGLIHSEKNEYEQALQKYQQALRTQRDIGEVPAESITLVDMGFTYEQLGDYGAAQDVFQQALVTQKQIRADGRIGKTLRGLALVQSDQGNYSEALALLQQSLALHRELGNRVEEANTMADTATIYQQTGQLDKATSLFYETITLLEIIRTEELPDVAKVSLFETQRKTYAKLQQVLIAQGKSEDALEVSERGRTRAFIELLAHRISTQTEEKLVTTPPNLETIKRIAQTQQATLVEYAIINSEIGDPRLYIWVISPTGDIVFEDIALGNIDLQDLITHSRKAIGVQGRAGIEVALSEEASQQQQLQQKQNLSTLYQLLIAPIAQHLPDDPTAPVIFIPQDELFFVPFPALIDNEDNYLIQNHTILTAPSIQVLDFTHQQQKRLGQVTPNTLNPDNVLLIGNPAMPSVYDPGSETQVTLPGLVGAEREVIDIANQLQTTPLINDAATETTVKARIEQASLVHLATHGLLEYGDRRESGIVDTPGAIALAPGQGEDGLLTATEILEMQLQASLVVLSACDTGLGTPTGDGVIGLSRGFMTAGVPSVMVSLWAVPDDSTAYLMTQFYDNWQTQGNKAQALRQAMLSTMETHPEPLSWAAFTLMGEAI